MTKPTPPQKPASKTERILKGIGTYGVIFLIALAIRLIYLSEIIDHPVITILLGDAESYDSWAQEILSKGWVGERTFYQAPFYPYFLALIYTLGGRDFIIVRIVQAVIGACSCTFLAAAARRFFDHRVGWAAGLLLAIYPPALFFDLLIQKAVLGMFFMCVLLFLLSIAMRADEGHKRTGTWILIGVTLACFALVRENALILTPATAVWVAVYYRRQGWSQIAAKALYVVIGLAIIFLPVTLRNYAVGGEFVLTTSQLGPNFYIGNNKDATGFYEPLVSDHSDWKFERTDAQNLAEKALGRKLTPNEVSDYWLNKTLADIKEEPVRWLRLMGKKWMMVWNATEASDSESIYAHYSFSTLLGLLGHVLHFGILLPLAILGLCLSWRQRHELWLLVWLWACFAGSVTLFFVFARYRHPMAAIMVTFAAAGLLKGYQALKEKHFTPLLVSSCLALLAAVAVNWPLISRTDMEAPTHFNIGYELEKRGQLDEAKDFYQRSIDLVEHNTLAHNNLGMVAMKQNQPDEALRHFQDAVKADPNNWDARVNLGIVLWQMGRKEEAIEHYREVVKHEPGFNPALCYNIACYYATRGQTAQGLEWLQRAIESGYDKWDLIRTDPDLDSLRDMPGFPTKPQ